MPSTSNTMFHSFFIVIFLVVLDAESMFCVLFFSTFAETKKIMARTKINTLRYYAKVVEITNSHYIEGLTTYAGIWRKYVNPIYPMSYETYMRIISYPRLNQELEELEAERAASGRHPRVSDVIRPEIWERPENFRVPRNQMSINFPE